MAFLFGKWRSITLPVKTLFNCYKSQNHFGPGQHGANAMVRGHHGYACFLPGRKHLSPWTSGPWPDVMEVFHLYDFGWRLTTSIGAALLPSLGFP
jgi:hypothetical protein